MFKNNSILAFMAGMIIMVTMCPLEAYRLHLIYDSLTDEKSSKKDSSFKESNYLQDKVTKKIRLKIVDDTTSWRNIQEILSSQHPSIYIAWSAQDHIINLLESLQYISPLTQDVYLTFNTIQRRSDCALKIIQSKKFASAGVYRMSEWTTDGSRTYYNEDIFTPCISYSSKPMPAANKASFLKHHWGKLTLGFLGLVSIGIGIYQNS